MRYKKDKRVGENYGHIKNKAKMKENKFLVEDLLLSQLKLHHLFFHNLVQDLDQDLKWCPTTSSVLSKYRREV